jgi:hypothetical protein
MKAEETVNHIVELPRRHFRNQIVSYDNPVSANAGVQLFNDQGWRAVQICVDGNQVIILLESAG